MPTLADLTANTARVVVAFGGARVEIEYAPALLTEKTIAGLMAVVQSAPAVAALPETGETDLAAVTSGVHALTSFTGKLNEVIAHLVRGWDLTEDDGVTMYPLTPERLAELPLAFRQSVVQAVFGDLRLGEPTGTRSQPTSRATSARGKGPSSAKRA